LLGRVEIAIDREPCEATKEWQKLTPVAPIVERVLGMHNAAMATQTQARTVRQLIRSLGKDRLRIAVMRFEPVESGCDVAQLTDATVSHFAESRPFAEAVLAEHGKGVFSWQLAVFS
jgi:hypothetical protein